MAKDKTKVRTKKGWTKDDTELAIMALPTTVWYLLFSYLPMFGIIIAFKKFKISGGFLNSLWTSEFVWFDNFKFLFQSRDTPLIIRNTLAYGITFVIVGTFLPLAAAIAINYLHSKKMAKVYQTMMFLPHFLSWVVVSALVLAFLTYDKGVINNMIANFGGDRVQWYMKPSFWPPFLVFMSIWKGLGNGMIVYLATLTGIDKTYYEAACIDGATIWQQIRYVTIPLMRSVIILLLIMRVGGIFATDFGLFYQVPRDSNSLYTVVYTWDVFVYKQLRSSTTGMASAAAMLQSVLSCIMILSTNAIVRKVDSESAMI